MVFGPTVTKSFYAQHLVQYSTVGRDFVLAEVLWGLRIPQGTAMQDWDSAYLVAGSIGLGAMGLFLLTRMFGGGDRLAAKVDAFCSAQQECHSAWRGKRVLIMVNPYGGNKTSRKGVQKVVQPMFDKAGIKYDVVDTTHAGHAKELVAKLKLSQYEAIIVVSGDGMFHELINGLAERPDLDASKVCDLCAAASL